MNYSEARAYAQKVANETGFDVGLECFGAECLTRILPRREHRYGSELRCEVVMCEILDKCQPGHGPISAPRRP